LHRENEGWGQKIVERLAKDLKTEFPNMSGLSERNLKYMRAFASAWPFFPFVQPPAAQLALPDQPTEASIVQPPVAQLQIDENQGVVILQPLLALVPWAHHITILDKIKDEEERLFYEINQILESIS
jgi:hypothetical protein